VAASSLTGISGLCLDGKKGVEIINHFLTHLETHYAWLVQAALCRRHPNRAELSRLFKETGTVGLAAYGASFIAFADKELTIAITKLILTTLNAEVPGLPEVLGWCVVLRDFVIQTNTLNLLENLMLGFAQSGWRKIKQTCSSSQTEEPPLPVLEDDLELAPLPITQAVHTTPSLGESDTDSDDEETGLLAKERPKPPVQNEEKGSFFRFFQKSPLRHGRAEYLESGPSTCLCM
jgi:hypothetical protein